jgi:SHS2 domain-containing protein
VADYRFFDHTGDFGLELTASGPADALDGVTRAFLELLTDAPGCVDEREARGIDVRGFDAADALVAFANELLYQFEAEGFLAARFAPTRVALDGGEAEIAGALHGEPYDPARHPIARPVKAVTHHGVRFEPREDGVWSIRLVFDL